MTSLASILVAAASPTGAPAAVPTPKPITIPTNLPNNLFAPLSWGDQHPFVLNAVKYLFIISCVALIALMSAQTTKTEGLSGTIGGRAESAYRGRLGFSEQLARLTTVAAVGFILLAISYFMITRS